MIKDVTDLQVYQEAMRLLPKLYELLNKLPLVEKDLQFQAKRAAHKNWRFAGTPNH